MKTAEPRGETVVFVRLLGRPAWRRGESEWQPLSRKDAALLALLAIEHEPTRDHTATLLWPNLARADACRNLRQRIFRLRKQVQHALIVAGETLKVAEGVEFDLDTLDTRVAAGHLDGAWELLGAHDYRPDGKRLDAWVRHARQMQRARRAEALSGVAQQLEASGDLHAATLLIEHLLNHDPLHEDLWRKLMRLHQARGDRAAAVAAFDRCAEALCANEGLTLSQDTLALLDLVQRPRVEGPQRPRLPLCLLRPPRLVGRHAELAAMDEAWRAGDTIVLIGEAGIGKSRLLAEFVGARPGCLIESALPGDNQLPYGTLSRAMRRTSQWPGLSLPADTRREMSRLLPELGQPPSAAAHEAVLLRAIETHLACAHAAGLQGLALDDLQHGDVASLRAIRRVVASVPGLRWILASRPPATEAPGDELRGTLQAAGRAALMLTGLDDAALRELLDSLGIVEFTGEALTGSLARHCGGNPLFVLETLKDVLLRGAEAKHPLPLPDSVGALIQQRLAVLSAQALALARVAGLASADFDAEMASEVLAWPLVTLIDPWAELEAAQVLHGNALAHELMRDVLLQGVPAAVQQPLHGRMAQCLARLGAEPERVAFHHAEAGAWEPAAEAALAAAARAARVGRREIELAQLRRATEWFDRVGLPRRAYAARLRSVKPCLMHEGPGPATTLADQLLSVAANPAEHAAASAQRARVANWVGDLVSARKYADIAYRSPASPPDVALDGGVGLAAALSWSGETDKALAIIAPLVERAGALDIDQRFAAWSVYGYVLAFDEQRRRAVDAIRCALGLASEMGDAPEIAQSFGNLASALSGLGGLQDAIEFGTQARGLYEVLGNPLASRMNALNLGYLLVGEGRYREAIETLDAVLDFAQREAQGSVYEFAAQEMLAEVWIALGRFDRAAPLLAGELPANMPIVRRLFRAELRARNAAFTGQDTAARLWEEALAVCELRPTSRMQRMRILLNASLHLPAARAIRQCTLSLRENREREFPPGDLLGRMRSAQAHQRAGNLLAACDDIEAALKLHQTVRHPWVHEPELFAVAHGVLSAVGRADEARSCARMGSAWLHEALPNVPADCRDGFLHHPLHAALLALSPPVTPR